MSDKLCFIILHYGDNYQLTTNAVNAIKQLEASDKADIVVVCNGEEFDIRKKVDTSILCAVDVIVLEENKGFSVGNNVGYAYAKNKDDYAFIVIMNNDVIIKQRDFISSMFRLYIEHPFHVCGPDIYTPYIAFHSNPLCDHVYSAVDLRKIIHKREMQKREFEKRFSLAAVKSYLLEGFAGRQLFAGFYKIWRKIKMNNCKFEIPASNVVLQGSCFIFSNDFIVENEKVFLPEVFLYFEEHYLAKRCKENKWIMYYSPELQVLHMHRGSSNLVGQSYRSYCQRKIQIEERFIAAAKEAMDILG